VDGIDNNHPVAGIGEFALIDRITAGLVSPGFVEVGLGDDAAVVGLTDPRVVVTTDMLVEGRHFRRAWSGPEDIGHRAAAANLADVVAMGADPRALVVAVALPSETEISWARQLLTGIADECRPLGAAVVGGDTTETDGGIVIAITALGDLDGRAAVLRGGARVGDVVALAGRQGWASAGLTVLSRGFRSPRVLVDALRRPDPPYTSGPEAARVGATSMIDVSDGLVADLRHIAKASKVGVELVSSLLPVDAPLKDTATAFSADPLLWVLTGGDDHSLVATFPPDVEPPVGFRRIGEVVPGDGQVSVDGEPFTEVGGWQHFGTSG
jgi:thiamine-monophosphate kinase